MSAITAIDTESHGDAESALPLYGITELPEDLFLIPKDAPSRPNTHAINCLLERLETLLLLLYFDGEKGFNLTEGQIVNVAAQGLTWIRFCQQLIKHSEGGQS